MSRTFSNFQGQCFSKVNGKSTYKVFSNKFLKENPTHQPVVRRRCGFVDFKTSS